MKDSISKPVLLVLVAGIVLIGGVIWLGLRPSPKSQAEPAAGATVEEKTPARVTAVAAKPAPVVIKQDNEELPPVIPISLTNFLSNEAAYNASAMKSLPQGTKIYGGIEFWLQGILRLQRTATRDEKNAHFPTHIEVPLDETNFADGNMTVNERGKNIACIYLLGGTFFASDEKFAAVVWHYADGTEARDKLYCQVHLRDWVRIAYEQPPQLPNALTKIAWHGPHPTRKDETVRLYRLALVNTHPEKTIRSLEFVSGMARPSLFVAALTLDPLMPGSRPDNLTSVEEPDPELKSQLQLFVQDTKQNPLAGAEVTWSFRSDSANGSGQKATTDLNGMALVRFPDAGLKALDVSANHDDYSGRKILWDLTSGDTVPASYTLKLGAEVKIGGFVVDPEENAISEATVSLHRFWSGSDMLNRNGEQTAFSTQRQTTDANGHWEAKGLPPDLLDHIGFDVTHPDFVGTNITVGANGSTERELRDGTHKIVLQRGLAVFGRVVDVNSYPISGATVWAGRKYFRDRQQTQTDAQGQFTFRNVTAGDMLFSAMARNHTPDSKSVDVHTNMAEIIFQLKAGNVLRAHVQDESGVAVAGARAGLEGSPGDTTYDTYEFTATTDGQGNFSWDSAPEGAIPFYIGHEGFEEQRGTKLTAGLANTVTLHRSRQLQGQVVDGMTQQPVTKFTIRTGTASGDDSNVYGIVQYKEFTAPDGRFTRTLTEAADNALAVYADGYADQIVRFPEAQNGVIQVVVQMKPSAGVSGVVLAPDGSPAPGVNVVASAPDQHFGAQLTSGHLRSFDSHNKMATSDADGHFKIGSAADDATVVAAGQPGFAQVPLAMVRSSGTITLQPWGRIMGTLKIGGQPAPGKDLLFNLTIPGISTDFNGYKSTTDDQGQFAMENVPPGDGAIVRLVRTSPNSWTHSDSTPVTVKPGETTQITLGDNGAVLVGRIRFDNPPTNASALNFDGHLSSQMPGMPAFSSADEAHAFFKTPEYQAMMKLRKNYAIEMNPDGSFIVDDVTPGQYSLNISASLKGERPWEHHVGQGSIPVTVPGSFNPASPIDIGEVVVQPDLRQ